MGMKKLAPQHATPVPDPDAVQIATTPDGRAVYQRKVRRFRNMPLKINGEQQYRRDRQTGEPAVSLRKIEPFERVEIYTLESNGAFGVDRVPYHVPTPEEVAAVERQRRIDEMGGGKLGAALVDAGMTPEQLLAKLAGETQTPAVADTWKPDLSDFPRAVGDEGTLWELSNGDGIEGDEQDAMVAESNLQARVEGKPEVYVRPDALPAH